MELQWTKSTLLGIVIATFLVNVSGSHTFYPMDCFYCFGGIDLPSRILDIWPWNSVGGQRFTFGDPMTSGLIGLAIGASQYYFHKKQEFLTAWWILWSTISFVLALIGTYIVSIFADDILIIGITQGVLYGLLTVRPITRQLKQHSKVMQEPQTEAA
jgi:TM2 domain-containing membrane protein YozV